MKFELNTFNRNTTPKELLDDLKEVAKKLNLKSLTIKQYMEHGKFHNTTYSNRFGTWINALENAGLQTKRTNEKLSKEDVILDIKLVALQLHKKTLTTFEYDNYGKYSASGISRMFDGSWLNALEEAGLEKSRTYGVTDEEYFENIEVVWRKLGRQPKYSEMEKPISKFSNGAYERRFGTWRKALEQFVDKINDNKSEILESKIDSFVETNNEIKAALTHKTKREINYMLRFLVLRRDNYKCSICGDSPATNPKTLLHIDHVIAWEKGGETLFENLQTLCSVCNLGKSNLDLNLDN
jgi:hypothetical protein